MPRRSHFTLPNGGPVAIDVIDVAGRHVRQLTDGRLTSGRHQLAWDRMTNHGERARPGVYLICMTTPEAAVVRRVVVID